RLPVRQQDRPRLCRLRLPVVLAHPPPVSPGACDDGVGLREPGAEIPADEAFELLRYCIRRAIVNEVRPHLRDVQILILDEGELHAAPQPQRDLDDETRPNCRHTATPSPSAESGPPSLAMDEA